MRNPKEMAWLDVVNEDFWWTNFISGIQFTFPGKGKTLSLSLKETLAMTDTGTSCTYFPTLIYEPIMTIFKELVSGWFIDKYGDLGIPCANIPEMPKINFLYGGIWLEMSPEDYIIEFEGECWACLGENVEDEYILLGDTFLRGWYSVHDHKNNRFGFVPHSESKKAAPVYGFKPGANLSGED